MTLSGIDDLQQPASSWLADAIDKLAERQSKGEDPSMDITVGGFTFEFRIKPDEVSADELSGIVDSIMSDNEDNQEKEK